MTQLCCALGLGFPPRKWTERNTQWESALGRPGVCDPMTLEESKGTTHTSSLAGLPHGGEDPCCARLPSSLLVLSSLLLSAVTLSSWGGEAWRKAKPKGGRVRGSSTSLHSSTAGKRNTPILRTRGREVTPVSRRTRNPK